MEKNLNASMKISECSQAKKKCEKVVNSDSVNGFSDLFDQQIDKGIYNFSLISKAENKNEQLSQNLLLIQWDAANIQKLFDAYDSIGPKWRLIAQIFGSKSENLAKNKFHLCLKKFLRKLNNFIKQKVYKHKKLIKYEGIIHIFNTSNPQYQMPETMKMWNIEIRKKIFSVSQKIALQTNVSDECLEWLMININKYNVDSKSYRLKKAKPIQIKKEKISEERFLAKSERGKGKANAARSIDQEQDAGIEPNEFEGSAILNNQISDPGFMHDFKFLIFDKDLANERVNDFSFVFDSNNSRISQEDFDRI